MSRFHEGVLSLVIAWRAWEAIPVILHMSTACVEAMKKIISLSGGIGSWCCLDKVLSCTEKENVIPVFCDTLAEDGDLYRFLDDIETHYGVSIVRICVGKTPFELAWEENYIYNSRVANCSRKLKSKPFREWLEGMYSPDEAVVCLGIDYTESHRVAAIEGNYKPYKTEFPLCEPPYIEKWEMLQELEKTGIRPPRLYALGFSHNNCGGCCFKAGIAHYRNLLQKDPFLFLEWENKEERLRAKIGKDVSILKRHGKPYTLKTLREETTHFQCSIFDDEEIEVGGCGCFLE